MDDYKLLFGKMLADLLSEKGLSQTKFAKEVGRTQSFVSKVIRGVNGPADNLKEWAEKLDLKGKSREEFLETGYLALSPQYIQKLVQKLKSSQAN